MNDAFFAQMDLGTFAVGPVEYQAETTDEEKAEIAAKLSSESSRLRTVNRYQRCSSPSSPSRHHARNRSSGGNGIIDFLFKRHTSRRNDVSPSPSPASSGAATPHHIPSPPYPATGRRGSVDTALPVRVFSSRSSEAPTAVPGYRVRSATLSLNTAAPARTRSKSNDPKLVQPWKKATAAAGVTTTQLFPSQPPVAPRNIDRHAGPSAALCNRRRSMAISGGNMTASGGTVSMNGTAATATQYRRFSMIPELMSAGKRSRSPFEGSATPTEAPANSSAVDVSPAEIGATPMSRLLMGSDIASTWSTEVGPSTRMKTIQAAPPSFGVDDFMVLFRNRAYSADLRNDRAMASVRAMHRHIRTKSDTSSFSENPDEVDDVDMRSPRSSVEDDGSNEQDNSVNVDLNALAADDGIPSPAFSVTSGNSSARVSTDDRGGGVDSIVLASRLLSLSTVAAQGVPDTIVEHAESQFDKGPRRHSLFELSENMVRAARIRRYGQSNMTENINKSNGTNISMERRRRLSTPVKPNLHLMAVKNCTVKTESSTPLTTPMLSLTKVMSNFPKYFTGEEYDPTTNTNRDGIDIRLPKRHLVLWRDRLNGTRIIPLTADGEDYKTNPSNAGDPNLTFVNLLKAHECYDVMPHHSKIVSFDVRLELICAFDGLIFNGVKAAPLWDDTEFRFIGMLTITDFVRILYKSYHHFPEQLNLLDQHNILKWRELLKEDLKDLITVNAKQSLYDAALCLHDNNIRRLLVVNPDSDNAPLYVLTNKRLMHFFHLMVKERKFPEFMRQSIGDLGVGTYNNLSTITMQSRLIDALTLFVERRISALPVVDELGKLVNAYAKYDTINLVPSQLYKNLNCTIQTALGAQYMGSEGVYLCQKTDTLMDIIRWLVNKNLHRLWIVDESNCLEGVISLSDVMNYLVIRPGQLATQDSLLDQPLDDDVSRHADDNNNDVDEISDVDDFDDRNESTTSFPDNDEPSIDYGQSTPRLTLEEAIATSGQVPPSIIVTEWNDSSNNAEVHLNSTSNGCGPMPTTELTEAPDELSKMEGNEEEFISRETAMSKHTFADSDRKTVCGDSESVNSRLPVDCVVGCYEDASTDSGEDSGSGIGSSVVDDEDLDNDDNNCTGSRMKVCETLMPVDGIVSEVGFTSCCVDGSRLATTMTSIRSTIGGVNKDESAYTSSSGLYDYEDS